MTYANFLNVFLDSFFQSCGDVFDIFQWEMFGSKAVAPVVPHIRCLLPPVDIFHLLSENPHLEISNVDVFWSPPYIGIVAIK